MNNNTPKSATTAGLLGIFLGSVGAHCWYLGDKKKGIIHVCLAGSGLLITLLSSVILPAALSFSALLTWAGILGILGALSAAIMSGNAIWGLVEGIMILSQGDAGLARKGYLVAEPVAPQQGYGYSPAQGQQPYPPMPNQPQYPQQPYPPMPNQPQYPQQPYPPMQAQSQYQPQPYPAEQSQQSYPQQGPAQPEATKPEEAQEDGQQ